MERLVSRTCPWAENLKKTMVGDITTDRCIIGGWIIALTCCKKYRARSQHVRPTTDSCGQVVWGSTKEVGCGMTKCGSVGGINNANYLVCNYGPP